MNNPSVSPSEMRKLTNMCDDDLEAMRAGLVPDDAPQGGGLAQFVRDLGEAFPEPSTAGLEQLHIAAIVDASRLMAENGEPVARPASKAKGPENQVSGLPKPRRQTMLQTVFATTAAKIAAGSIAVVLTFTGVAVAGVLPDSFQNAVADAAQVVGVDLPGGTDGVEDVDLGTPDSEAADIDESGIADEQQDGNVALPSEDVDADDAADADDDADDPADADDDSDDADDPADADDDSDDSDDADDAADADDDSDDVDTIEEDHDVDSDDEPAIDQVETGSGESD